MIILILCFIGFDFRTSCHMDIFNFKKLLLVLWIYFLRVFFRSDDFSWDILQSDYYIGYFYLDSWHTRFRSSSVQCNKTPINVDSCTLNLKPKILEWTRFKFLHVSRWEYDLAMGHIVALSNFPRPIASDKQFVPDDLNSPTRIIVIII